MVRNFSEKDISSFSAKLAAGNMKWSDQTLYQTLAQDDFSHGYGFKDLSDPTGYSFSGQYIDTRMPHAVMMMTKMVDASAMDTGLTNYKAVKFIEYGDDVYMLTVYGVYKWDTTNLKWLSTGMDTGICRDGVEDGTFLYVSFDDGRAQWYDGTWHDFVQDNANDLEWGCRSGGFIWFTDDVLPYVHYSATPATEMEGGDPDTGDPDAIRVGPGNIPIQGIIPWNNATWVAREDGLWYMPNDDTASLSYQAVNKESERHPRNFKSMCVWQDALIYTLKNELYKRVGSSVQNITPSTYGNSFPYERHGNFRFLTPVGPYLYVVADESRSSSAYGALPYGVGTYGGGNSKEVLLCYDGVAWHKLVEICDSGDTVTGMNYTPVNDKLWISVNLASGLDNYGAQPYGWGKYGYGGTDDKTYYIPLRTTSYLPYELYETTDTPPQNGDTPHYLYTSRFDAGLATITKHFSSLAIKGTTSPHATVDVYYSVDGGGWIALGTADVYSDAAPFVISFPANVTGKAISFRLNFQTDNQDVSPVLEAIILQYMPRPDTIYSHTLDIISADLIKTLDQRLDQHTSYQFYTFLKRARNHKSPVTLEDRWGIERSCYCTAVEWLPRSMAPDSSSMPKEIEGIIRATFASAESEDEDDT